MAKCHLIRTGLQHAKHIGQGRQVWLWAPHWFGARRARDWQSPAKFGIKGIAAVHTDSSSKGNCVSNFSLAVCFPVWNRPDLFKVCFDSLLAQLAGIQASIWIFDNGSDAPTRELISRLNSQEHRLFKILLPQNMGIPFVVNLFSQVVSQDCDFSGHRSPSHIMLADADGYYKHPISDLIEILEANSRAGIVSGHDSIEHAALNDYQYELRGNPVLVKEKKIERGTCLIMKQEALAACVPIPHDTNANVDWQLMRDNPCSMARLGKTVLAVDYVVHIGLYDSTWHEIGIPADQREVDEINHVLNQEKLISPARLNRMKRYCAEFGLNLNDTLPTFHPLLSFLKHLLRMR